MVEEKARVLLSRNELLSLSYYQEEYAMGHMTIEAFVTVLLELLNTPEKVSKINLVFHFEYKNFKFEILALF